MFKTWVDFDTYMGEVLEEAGFIAGYRKTLKWATDLDPEIKERGDKIVKKAHNIRANIYRYRDARALATKKKTENYRDPELVAKYQKEAEEAENRIVVYGLDLLRLRVPLDDFLFESDIPPRPRWGTEKLEYEAGDEPK